MPVHGAGLGGEDQSGSLPCYSSGGMHPLQSKTEKMSKKSRCLSLLI